MARRLIKIIPGRGVYTLRRLRRFKYDGDILLKLCPSCRKWLPADTDAFATARSEPLGLYSQCRQCKSRAMRSRYIPNSRTLDSVRSYLLVGRAARR